MAMDFSHRFNSNDLFNMSMLSVEGGLDSEEIERLKRLRRAWNFYDGYHWEEIDQQDKPQITENYCSAYVNKFVAFEMGKSFAIKFKPEIEKLPITNDGTTVSQFVYKVWDRNKQNLFCMELGQMKSITGDSWVQVKFFKPEDSEDPFGEYPDGTIRVMVLSTSVCFPEYDVHDKDRLVKLVVQYPIEVQEESAILKKTKFKKIVYKQVWTSDRIEIYEGKNLLVNMPNKYGTIPFIQVKNFPVAGRSEGKGDIEDIIPLNVELNLKKSDISEIIDYHSAPVTVVFGAKISSLEKGANKIWGGLPKDAKVQNLELGSDLRAAVDYVYGLRKSMNEIGSVPEGSLGGSQSISNTSGVALQFANMPLIERTRVKRMCSQVGLELINKMILLVALKEGIIKKPDGVSNYDFYYTEVKLPDTMPKDELIELQLIEQEMRLGLEDRKTAMQRLGKENVETKIAEIDADRNAHPDIYAIQPKETNSGLLNGDTALETTRKEINGANRAV